MLSGGRRGFPIWNHNLSGEMQRTPQHARVSVWKILVSGVLLCELLQILFGFRFLAAEGESYVLVFYLRAYYVR